MPLQASNFHRRRKIREIWLASIALNAGRMFPVKRAIWLSRVHTYDSESNAPYAKRSETPYVVSYVTHMP